jgi:hypothetical protein
MYWLPLGNDPGPKQELEMNMELAVVDQESHDWLTTHTQQNKKGGGARGRSPEEPSPVVTATAIKLQWRSCQQDPLAIWALVWQGKGLPIVFAEARGHRSS